MRLPRLLLLSLGGAGHAAPIPGGQAAGALSNQDHLADIAEIRAEAPLDLPAASLAPEHLVAAAQRIEDALAEEYDGAVVVQGPDTIEESAFILDLLVPGPKPVIVTQAAPDAKPDLLAAARVAASAEARGLGTLVVLGAEIHAARFVQRHRAGTFHSPQLGPIGAVAEGRARFRATVPRLPVLPSYGGPPRPVALLRWGMGDDARRLGSLAMLGYAGAVIEGMGEGQVPMQAAPLLAELAARMPVVLASRSPAGAVFVPRQDSGGAVDLLSRGLIAAGHLSGLKARLLLGLALRGGAGHAAAASAFAPYQ